MRFIHLDKNNMVVSTRVGAKIVEGEIQSDVGECGQIKQADGSFITPSTPPPIPQPIQPTNQELSDNQLILMDVLATLYEDMLAKGTV